MAEELLKAQALSELVQHNSDGKYDAIGGTCHQKVRTSNPQHDRKAASVTNDPEMIAAAWLRDVVEDTSVTLEDVQSEFGEGVAELAEWLTDVSRPEDGNREKRKAIARAHLAQASSRTKTVKLPDIIDNARDIAKHDPSFGRVYIRESGELLKVFEQR